MGRRASRALLPRKRKLKPKGQSAPTPVAQNKHKRSKITNNNVSKGAQQDPAQAVDQAKESKEDSLVVFQNDLEAEEEAKKTIAGVASSLLQDPETHIRRKLKVLIQMCGVQSDVIRRLALASTMAVFKDIIPGYRIKELTEKQKTEKVSKEVAKRREWESALTHYYQQFLEVLRNTCKKYKRSEKLNTGDNSSKTDALIAIKCLSQLLISHPTFNYSALIISTLVPFLNSDHDEMRKSSSAALVRLFVDDTESEMSFHAVKSIYRLTKSRQFSVKPEMVSALLKLKFDQEEVGEVDILGSSANAKAKNFLRNKRRREMKQMSRKQRENIKLGKEIEKEMQEAEAVGNKSKKARFQTEILKLIFMLYFNVIKNCSESPILFPVLRGIAKYAYLINVDFQYDLFQQLIRVMESNQLPIATAFQCVLTAFDTLDSHEKTLSVDLKAFYTQLYALLIQLGPSNISSCISILRKCIRYMITDREQMSATRLASFVKRIISISLHLPPSFAVLLVSDVLDISRRHSRIQELVCGEGERGTVGQYRPDVDDPEHANATASILWELCLLQNSSHPLLFKKARELMTVERLLGSNGYQFQRVPATAELNAPPDFSYVPVPKPHKLRKVIEKRKKRFEKQAMKKGEVQGEDEDELVSYAFVTPSLFASDSTFCETLKATYL